MLYQRKSFKLPVKRLHQYNILQVGICVIMFALSAAINAFLIGKVFGQRGLLPLIIFEIVFDVALYIFCLFWEPTSETTWIVYVFFGLLGIYNSTPGMIASSKALIGGVKIKFSNSKKAKSRKTPKP